MTRLTFAEHLARVTATIRTVTVEQARADRAARSDLRVIDVRQRDACADGVIEGARVIPRGTLDVALPQAAPDRDAPLLIYCASGARSALAAASARALGYTDVASLEGGFEAWKQASAPFHIPALPDPPDDPERDAAPGPDAPSLSPNALADALSGPTPPHVIDLREDEEVTTTGHIAGATLQPGGLLEPRIKALTPDPTQPLVLVSSRGVRAAFAARSLGALGYDDVRVLDGGVQAWTHAGLPLVKPRRLSPEERARYSRHLRIPEVGEAGQLKLLGASALLVGVGGLGSPVALYLAAAGVGRLGLIDDDVVDRSNLQRQVLHTDARVGTPKVDSAAQALRALNPAVRLETHNVRLTSANVVDLFSGYDVVIDGGDNFPTRYLVNDACVHLGIPCVHGSVYRFEGQLTVIDPGRGPCYRCLYPKPPPPELAPSCAEAGVLGVLPGIVGLLQANEALKLLLGVGEPLRGRLLHVDALGTRMRELRLGRDPACPVCADDAVWEGFIDYDQFCRGV